MTSRRFASIAAELSVVALSIAVVLGLERLFTTTEFRADLIGMALAAHGLAVVTRRAGVGMLISSAVSGIGLLVVGNLLLFPETAGSLVPTRETIDFLDADLALAWDVFEAETAPVEPLRGFVVIVAAALWWIAVLADWAAFRLKSALEAVAPATALFVVTAVLGSDTGQIRHALLFAGAVAFVLLTMRVERQAREEVWVASGVDRGVSASLRVGTVIAAFALVFGALAGPAVPNADQQILDPTEWDNGPGTRRVGSPLVEVSASLIEQSRIELFSVRVEDPATDRNYWRLMALDEFTGDQWRVSSNFEDALGPVATDVALDVPRRVVRQEVTTRSLQNIYLPAAYEVTNVVDNGGVELEYEVSTGALVVQRGAESDAEGGFTYVVESAVPDFTPELLPADATIGLPPSFVEDHTALPRPCTPDDDDASQCWPESVTILAETITAGATTDYERMVLLQDHFLAPGNYEYDLQVALEHDITDTEQFLTVVRRGYCQQFANAFASMARSLGIPARIAVGFTWGEYSPSRGEYIVRGEHGHAWPEVFFAGVGWVTFDPTPGRAPAHSEALTGLAPAQLNENDDANSDGLLLPSPTTIPAPRPNGPGGFDERLFPNLLDESEPAQTLDSTDGNESGGFLFDRGVLLRGLIVIAALGAILSAVPLTRAAVHRRRKGKVATDPVGRAELAWDDAVAGLRLIGVTRVPSETALEFSRRATQVPQPIGPVVELATQVTVLRYGCPADPVPHAIAAQEASKRVIEHCRAHAGRRKVTIDQLDPRALRLG